MKTCTKCGQSKSLEDFYLEPKGILGRKSQCKACCIAYISNKTKENRQPHNDTRMLRRYGITKARYNEMVEEQEGLCFLCREPPGKKALAVDHDHSCCPGKISCGKCVRRLLCTKCNVALGLIHEKELTLLNMLDYIKL